MTRDFKIRLYDFEVAPPGHLWNRISEAIDEEFEREKIGTRLRQTEILPPTNTWNRIASALEGKPAAIPVLRKLRPYYKYAAAAVIIGVILLSANLLFSDTSAPPASVQPGLSTSGDKPAVNSESQLKATDTENKIERNALVAGEDNPIASNNLPKRVVKSALTRGETPAHYARQPAELNSDFSFAELEGRTLNLPPQVTDYDPSRANRISHYILLLRPDGYVVKMSRKFADLIGCMYSESLEPENEQCQKQLKEWRAKMAKSPLAPSHDNFMDILTMIKSFQEQ